ncbi:hypothetical protein tb265_15330 [Gemmatimonadetes bacterium T265]|nr:hypothetical protein tb265_15330 [Gemmatimonadetes bacterium T265]
MWSNVNPRTREPAMPSADRYSKYRADQTTVWISKTAAEFMARERAGGEGTAAVLDRLIGELRRHRRANPALAPEPRPAAKGAAKSAGKSAGKTAAKGAGKTAAKGAAKSAGKTAAKAAAKGASKTAAKGAAKAGAKRAASRSA